MKNLEKVEKLLNEIYDDIVSQATPAMYIRGEFEDLIDKCFDEKYSELEELIGNLSSEESAAYFGVAEKCADRYEEKLTEKFFNCVGLERD